MNKMRTMKRFVAMGALCVLASAGAAETTAQRDTRMAWWREAKFGMFIHWGVYAVPAGIHNGRPVDGIGEWIMLRGKIPVAAYKAFAPQFTASQYDPDVWAALAKEAGMRYIIITSKHHDGFALFDSHVSAWDAVDASGARRDLIKPLAAAARKQGLKFGLYYSQAQDWTHPGGAKSGYKEGDSWDDASKGSFDAYLRDIAIPQTREILTQYRPDVLWWDTPVWMTPSRAAPLHALLALNPGIISNNRLGGDFAGDTETPEQHIPATGFKGRDWEVCMTMNDTWGFKSDDHNWKSTKDIIHKLCDIVSKGGIYLLNVGPDATGVIPAASVQRLKEVGAWMKVNGEAIYGTTASPFPNLPWGRCTRKGMRKGPWGLFGKTTRLYLHVFDWPSDGKLLVPDLTNKPVAARLLADGTSLTFAVSKEGIRIETPAQAPDAIASVVVLDVVGDVATLPYVVKAADNGKVELRPDAARLSGQLRAHGFIHVNFERWTNPKDYAEWTVDIPKAGKYRLETQAGAVKAAKVVLVAGSRRLEIPVAATGEVTRYKPVKAGPMELAAGRQNIRLEAAPADWSPVNMRTLALIPED